MSKQFTPFWKKTYDSVQERYPHHTILCMTCGYLYNRRARVSRRCPKCGHYLKHNKISEFYVGKSKIYYGRGIEKRRKAIDRRERRG
jgi:hypothetical protein